MVQMISLRPARPDDSDMVLEWRNEPFVYAHSNSGKPVKPSDHRVWFAKQVNHAISRLFIIISHEGPSHHAVGVVRYELNKDLSSICMSIFLPEKFTGNGYGTAAIKECCREIRERWPTAKISAEIKHENKASRKAFTRAGFVSSVDNVMVYR